MTKPAAEVCERFCSSCRTKNVHVFLGNVWRGGGRREVFVIFVWVPACWRTLPGDRIAVDTAETGEHQPPRAGRISSESGVSGSGGVCRGESAMNRCHCII